MKEMDGEFMSIVATTLSNSTVKKTRKRRSKDVQRDQTWWADFDLIVKRLILFLRG